MWKAKVNKRENVRERERERDRQTDRQTEKERERKTNRQRKGSLKYQEYLLKVFWKILVLKIIQISLRHQKCHHRRFYLVYWIKQTSLFDCNFLMTIQQVGRKHYCMILVISCLLKEKIFDKLST